MFLLNFFQELQKRNLVLFYFGGLCFASALIFFVLAQITTLELDGVSVWYKPFKFAVSIAVFIWTIAWYVFYLKKFSIMLFNRVMISLFSFELVYIVIQAARAEYSHFNLSTSFYALMFVLMAIASALISFYTLYVAYLFFRSDFPNLSLHYLWAIRLALLLFVIFSLEGFLMGSRLSHTVGALNDNSNLFVLAWSKTVGDLRVAHFIGMHALQVLPLCSFYALKNLKLTLFFAALYALLAFSTLVQALEAKPLFF